MYERNAIVIDRYFESLFGYNLNNNLKNNANNYFELVKKLEQYQIAYENENNIMLEFEKVANNIKETQKLQETFNKRHLRYVENTRQLFENLEEESSVLQKKFENISEENKKNEEEIQTNIKKFVTEIKQFHEKSEIRSECGRQRKEIESEYQKQLKITTENFEKISKEKLKDIKAFAKSESKEEEKQQIREKILQNGSKEKVPFDINVINKAIDVATDIEGKKAQILLSIYDKTGKLFDEIKNDNVRIERHKKIVKDAGSKLEYLNSINEYIILFLDNERMNIAGGEREHEKVMIESCVNVQKDLIQIQNMYSLLLKEITDKSSKKAYRDLYNREYLYDLEQSENEFEKSLSTLNMAGIIVYPDHWRIEGMRKIYETFKFLITENYGKDLSEFEQLNITADINRDLMEIEKEDTITNNIEADKTEKIQEPERIKEKKVEKIEEEFQWDDEDENEELNFGGTEILKDYEEDEENEDFDYNFTEDEEVKLESDKNDENDENEPDIFDTENDVLDNIKEEIEDEEDEEDERDKEIDNILGFFDDDDSLDELDEESDISSLDDELDEENDISSLDDDIDAEIDKEIDDDDFEDDDLVNLEEKEKEEDTNIENKEEIEEEDKKSKKKNKNKKKKKDEDKTEKKRMSLFGRRKK